jgi:hypothetical protein
MKWIVAVGAAFASLVWGYYTVAYAACTWFWPDSNLCGLIAVPSAIVAAVAAFLLVIQKWK